MFCMIGLSLHKAIHIPQISKLLDLLAIQTNV